MPSNTDGNLLRVSNPQGQGTIFNWIGPGLPSPAEAQQISEEQNPQEIPVQAPQMPNLGGVSLPQGLEAAGPPPEIPAQVPEFDTSMLRQPVPAVRSDIDFSQAPEAGFASRTPEAELMKRYPGAPDFWAYQPQKPQSVNIEENPQASQIERMGQQQKEALNQALDYQPFHPEQWQIGILPSAEQYAKNHLGLGTSFLKGGLQAIGQLGTPRNALIAGGMALGPEFIAQAADAVFAWDMAHGLVQHGQQIKQAYDQRDYNEVARLLPGAGLNAYLLGHTGMRATGGLGRLGAKIGEQFPPEQFSNIYDKPWERIPEVNVGTPPPSGGYRPNPYRSGPEPGEGGLVRTGPVGGPDAPQNLLPGGGDGRQLPGSVGPPTLPPGQQRLLEAPSSEPPEFPVSKVGAEDETRTIDKAVQFFKNHGYTEGRNGGFAAAHNAGEELFGQFEDATKNKLSDDAKQQILQQMTKTSPEELATIDGARSHVKQAEQTYMGILDQLSRISFADDPDSYSEVFEQLINAEQDYNTYHDWLNDELKALGMPIEMKKQLPAAGDVLGEAKGGAVSPPEQTSQIPVKDPFEGIQFEHPGSEQPPDLWPEDAIAEREQHEVESKIPKDEIDLDKELSRVHPSVKQLQWDKQTDESGRDVWIPKDDTVVLHIEKRPGNMGRNREESDLITPDKYDLVTRRGTSGGTERTSFSSLDEAMQAAQDRHLEDYDKFERKPEPVAEETKTGVEFDKEKRQEVQNLQDAIERNNRRIDLLNNRIDETHDPATLDLLYGQLDDAQQALQHNQELLKQKIQDYGLSSAPSEDIAKAEKVEAEASKEQPDLMKELQKVDKRMKPLVWTEGRTNEGYTVYTPSDETVVSKIIKYTGRGDLPDAYDLWTADGKSTRYYHLKTAQDEAQKLHTEQYGVWEKKANEAPGMGEGPPKLTWRDTYDDDTGDYLWKPSDDTVVEDIIRDKGKYHVREQGGNTVGSFDNLKDAQDFAAQYHKDNFAEFSDEPPEGKPRPKDIDSFIKQMEDWFKKGMEGPEGGAEGPNGPKNPWEQGFLRIWKPGSGSKINWGGFKQAVKDFFEEGREVFRLADRALESGPYKKVIDHLKRAYFLGGAQNIRDYRNFSAAVPKGFKDWEGLREYLNGMATKPLAETKTLGDEWTRIARDMYLQTGLPTANLPRSAPFRDYMTELVDNGKFTDFTKEMVEKHMETGMFRDARKMMQDYVHLANEFLWERPETEAARKFIGKQQDSVDKRMAEWIVDHYTGADVASSGIFSAYKRFENRFTTLGNWSVLALSTNLQMLHVGRYLMTGIPSLGRDALPGMISFLKNPKAAVQRAIDARLLTQQEVPSNVRTPRQKFDLMMNMYDFGNSFTKVLVHEGMRAKYQRLGDPDWKLKAVTETAKAEGMITPYTRSKFGAAMPRVLWRFKDWFNQYGETVAKWGWDGLVKRKPEALMQFGMAIAAAAVAEELRRNFNVKLSHIHGYNPLKIGSPESQFLTNVFESFHFGEKKPVDTVRLEREFARFLPSGSLWLRESNKYGRKHLEVRSPKDVFNPFKEQPVRERQFPVGSAH